MNFKNWGKPSGVAATINHHETDLKKLEESYNKALFFKEWTTGPQGCRYELFVETHHTEEDVENAKKWLKNNLDVVKIYVENES